MSDFASDMEALGVAAEQNRYRVQDDTAPRGAGREAPRPPRPPAALSGALGGDFFAGILPPEVKVAPYEGQDHPCARCVRIADEARADGQYAPAVRQADSWVGPNGHRYWAGTCRPCADIEYSLRWTRRYALAQKEGDRDKQLELELEKQRWLQKGRKFHG